MLVIRIVVKIVGVFYIQLKRITEIKKLRRYKHKIPTSISYFSPKKKKILK